MRRYIIILLIATMLSSVLSFSASAASGTVYESEPNDDFSTADWTYNDYNSYGAISQSDFNGKGDMWKITVPYSGYANFYLGHIPSGCNYELCIYKHDLSGVLAYSYNTGNKRELVSAYVEAGKTYYIYVFSISGYSSSNYLLRVKVYPVKTLSMNLYEQPNDFTCSTTSGRMVLSKYGVNVTHAVFYHYSQIRYKTEWDYVYALTETINHFLDDNNIYTNYQYIPVGQYSNDEYNNLIIHNIVYNYPIIPLIAIYDYDYFSYQTSGHYVALKGTTFNPTTRVFSAIINDPKDGASQTITIPTSALWGYNLSHWNPHVICVKD